MKSKLILLKIRKIFNTTNVIIAVILFLANFPLLSQYFTNKVKYDVIYFYPDVMTKSIKEPSICYFLKDFSELKVDSKNKISEVKTTFLLQSFYKKNYPIKKIMDSLSKKYKLNWLRVGISRINKELFVNGCIVEFNKNKDSVLVYCFCPDSSEYKYAENRHNMNYDLNYKDNFRNVMREVEKARNFNPTCNHIHLTP